MAEDDQKTHTEEDRVRNHVSIVPKQTPLKDVSNATTSPELSPPHSKADQGLIPHATTSGTNIVEGIVETGKAVAEKVEAAIDDGVAWFEKKAHEINVDGGVGPYASPGTCLNSDLDVIGTGLLPAMTKAEDARKAEENPEDGSKADVETKEAGSGFKGKDGGCERDNSSEQE